MNRILVLYYSQSGEVERAIHTLVQPLEAAGVEIVWERIEPTVHYPYPWKSVYEFFDVFPECVNHEPPPIPPPQFDPDDAFDLVILAYQVWFLAPSLPIQGFLRSPYARVLKDRRVITLIVCRSMWYSASEAMKTMIADAGGVLIDNVVVTFKGPALATFVTAPRKLLSGRQDRFMGLPEAETQQEDVANLERFGRVLAQNLDALHEPTYRSLFRGMDAVDVKPRIALMETWGYHAYHAPWGKLVRRFGTAGSQSRKPLIYMFVVTLVLTMPTGILLALLAHPVIYALFKDRIDQYLDRLAQPSGSAKSPPSQVVLQETGAG